MKLAVLASLFASAAAFAPSKSAVRSSSLAANPYEDELGAMYPLGFYDPWGLSEGVDQEQWDQFRAAELKHGRVSQLGVIGYLTTASGARLPGAVDFSGTQFTDVDYGWAGSKESGILMLATWLGICGFLETQVWKQQEGSFPGDFSASSIPVGWISDFSEETKLDLRTKELNQGRAAMMGLFGLMVHDVIGNVEDILPFDGGADVYSIL